VLKCQKCKNIIIEELVIGYNNKSSILLLCNDVAMMLIFCTNIFFISSETFSIFIQELFRIVK